MPHRPRLNHFPSKLLSIILLQLLLTVSCTTFLAPARDSDPLAREDENFQDFLDVPYPSAMTVEKSKVQVYDRRGVLSGTYSILGKLSPDEILDYYDRHLPKHGWQPLSEAQTESEIISTWTKGNKTLIIQTSKVTLAIGADTRAKIWVAPPHTKSDLGKRVIYRDTSEPGKSWSTTPIRQPKGGHGDVHEENL
ncbi:MAG: hypothetical protein LBE27_02095 [Deltaproteobacteria bacterium]|jgi:hypothetical protein|nr:hypothetical protein [Deltaproteobacteria bacterium]